MGSVPLGPCNQLGNKSSVTHQPLCTLLEVLDLVMETAAPEAPGSDGPLVDMTCPFL